MNKTDAKIIMYNLNLDYKIKELSLENQTNMLINRQMNEFVKLYSGDTEKTFIIDYKDDLISLICYRIVKNIQTVSGIKFNLLLSGKTRKTRKFIDKKEKRIPSFLVKSKMKKSNVFLISPINPIYKVLNEKTVFKKFNCKVWKPMESFTPNEVLLSQVFYHIGYLKNEHIFEKKKKEVEIFQELCDGQVPFEEEVSLLNLEKFTIYNKDISLVKLTNDDVVNERLLNEIEDFEGLIFYYWEKRPEILTSFENFIKIKANVSEYFNVNQYTVPAQLIRDYHCKPFFYGNWSAKEKELLED